MGVRFPLTVVTGWLTLWPVCVCLSVYDVGVSWVNA